MSDDFVTRLQTLSEWNEVSFALYQAAREIERLRVENTDLRRAITEQNQLNRFTNITEAVRNGM